jgi:hypothetical protein
MSPTGKCDHFEKSFPGGEDAYRTHCKGHLCLDGPHPNPSACGCHGGNVYVPLGQVTQEQTKNLTASDQGRLLQLTKPDEKTRACIGWLPCEPVTASTTHTFQAPHGIDIRGRPFKLFVQARSKAEPDRIWFLCDDIHSVANDWRNTSIGYTDTDVFLRVTSGYSSWPAVSGEIEIRFLIELFE